MYNIQSILEWMMHQIHSKNPRFEISPDYMHVKDNHTGIEYHLYDNWSKITHGDNTIATSHELTEDENKILWKIRELITPPNVMQQHQSNFHQRIYDKRSELAEHYATPKPVESKQSHIVAEKGTKPYKG